MELPYSLAQKQRQLLKATNLDDRFLLHFNINSKYLAVHAIVLLGQNSTNFSMEHTPPEGQYGTVLYWVPKI